MMVLDLMILYDRGRGRGVGGIRRGGPRAGRGRAGQGGAGRRRSGAGSRSVVRSLSLSPSLVVGALVCLKRRRD